MDLLSGIQWGSHMENVIATLVAIMPHALKVLAIVMAVEVSVAVLKYMVAPDFPKPDDLTARDERFIDGMQDWENSSYNPDRDW